ncbi:MAG TPA: DUF4149 domain-containing protein [Terriglobales bacterium]|jgi:hypothetical protein|nr:DUF4149 domain-containing protein [Terriglobales bacterium]
MTVLRFFMLLSLVVWIGGIVFFAFVVAPALFSLLPNTHLAGLVVTRSLKTLHWIGLVAGLVYVLTSFAYARVTTASVQPLAARNVLMYIMLALTAVLQFSIIPRMDALRLSVGQIDAVASDNPVRVQFDALHVWSTRLEGAVLLLGLALIYLTARVAVQPRSATTITMPTSVMHGS